MVDTLEKIVIVTRRSVLDELVLRFSTRAQARFYLERAGHDFADIEHAHDQQQRVLESVREALPRGLKTESIDRDTTPRYTFGASDLVVVVGQDGLVSNTAKYLHGQPVLAINPDPARYDGVLLPFRPAALAPQFEFALAGALPRREVTLAEVRSSDNQSLLAFNDIFVGARSHTSARYEIAVDGHRERQSSSGIIVSTGAGSTGWLQSIYAGAVGVVEALGGRVVPPADGGRLAWDSDRLVYSVREPFPSGVTATSVVHGSFTNAAPLSVRSEMPRDGVVFSDGVEADYIEFNAGTEITVGTAQQKAVLLAPK